PTSLARPPCSTPFPYTTLFRSLMRLWVEAEVLRLTNERAARARRAGTPGPEGSTAKLHWADLNKRIYSFCVDLMGPEGMLYPETDRKSTRLNSSHVKISYAVFC